MRVKQKYYPHPVLKKGTDDYSDCEFYVKIKPQIDQTNYTFYVYADTTNVGLKDLILNEDATYSIHIECSNTRFRKIIKSTNSEFSFTIPSSCLDGKVELCSFINASKDIDEYSNESFNKDYEGMNFKIYKGDILAIADEFSFIADKEIDPLIKVPSIFNIIRDDKKGAPPINIDSSGDKVNIVLSRENFKKYGELKILQKDYNYLAPLVSSLFIIPAIVMILDEVKSRIEDPKNDLNLLIEEMDNHRWFKVLKSKLEEIGIKIDEPNAFIDSTLIIAQRLVGEPLTQGLKFFDEIHTLRESD